MSRGVGRKTTALRAAILNTLAAYPDLRMSSRQVFYQCVSSGAIQNNARECDRVLRLLVEMRRDGAVPYRRIVDRTRAKHQVGSWDGVRGILDSVSLSYRRNLWADQDTVCMIACEKSALEGVFAEACDEWGAALWTLRGFSSEGFAYDWAEDILRLNRARKDVAIAYFGDFDPSGLAIEEDARGKLVGFGARFSWTRAGLLRDDLDRFNLVPLPVKRSDTRAKAFLSKFGDRGAELDALRPDVLQERVRESIISHIDGDAWTRMEVTERAEREDLELVAGNWVAALAGARGAA